MTTSESVNLKIDPASPAVVLLSGDSDVCATVARAVNSANGTFFSTATAERFVELVDQCFPFLAILDLNVVGWKTAVRRCKLRPFTRQTPIHAFIKRMDESAEEQARQAGADRVWSQAGLMRELPELVACHVAPPVRYPAGWDEPLDAEARVGLAAFNRGEYFDQHEFFEEAWRAESRPIRDFYQGILQVGVAFLQIQRGNRSGALKMFRGGLPKLRDLPAICQGVRLARFRAASEVIHAEITALDPALLSEFDQRRFPRLELVDRDSHRPLVIPQP